MFGFQEIMSAVAAIRIGCVKVSEAFARQSSSE